GVRARARALRTPLVDPVTSLARAGAAFPVRRLRAVPPFLASAAAAPVRADGLLADRRDPRRVRGRPDRERDPASVPLTKEGRQMTYTPVELRHVRLPRGLVGYR